MIMEGFLGQIYYFGGNFAPRNFAYCNGELLPISQYNALFAVLGIAFGGDARTTFQLPDTRGRFIISEGSSSADPYIFERGVKGGSSSVTLTENQMPSHTHTAKLVLEGQPNSLSVPAANGVMGASPSSGPSMANIYSADTAPDVPIVMSEDMLDIGNSGGGQPFPILPPYLAIPAVICTVGEFPSRN
jgi:microcystin-dependent protein